MKSQKMFLSVLYVFFSLTPAEAMWEMPQDISDNRKQMRSKIANNILSRVLEIKETENNIQTRCQIPDQKRAQHTRSLMPRFGNPIPESFLQDSESWKETEEYKNQIEIRNKVDETSLWPYCVHGVVEVRSGNSLGWGTGTMIGPNLVLTAAHTLYSTDKKQKVDKVFFIPARNGQDEPFGRVRASKFYITKKYEETVKTRENGEEDYGLLVLDKDLSPQTGYFGLNILTREQIEEKGFELNVTGYPADKVRNENGEYTGRHELWGTQGKYSRIDNNYIYYKDSVIRTYKGQSGSAVYYHDIINNQCFIVGVHVHGTTTKDGENSATFLTQERFNQIKEWIVQSNILKKIVSKEKESIKEIALDSLYSPNYYNSSLKTFLGRVVYAERNNGNFLITDFLEYNLSHLKKLDLSKNNISHEGIIAIAGADWPHLEELNLNSNKLGQGVEPLPNNDVLIYNMLEAASKGFTPSRELINLLLICIMTVIPKPMEACEALSKAEFPKLKRLYLDKNNLEWKVKLLVSANWWNRLETLSLRNNNFEDSLIEYLITTFASSIKNLDLGGNKLGDLSASTSPAHKRNGEEIEETAQRPSKKQRVTNEEKIRQ